VPAAPTGLRSVHLIERDEHFGPFWKSICYDPARGALRPNLTFVNAAGTVLFETNEAGLTGPPLDPRRKLAVVWGDSVVFCAGRSWVPLLEGKAPGWQFLNGGIDGDPASNILERAAAFNAAHRVALNLLLLGWHPFVPSWWRDAAVQRGAVAPRVGEAGAENAGNHGLRERLREFLRRHANTVLLTVATALNPDNLATPMSQYRVEGSPEIAFRVFGDTSREVAGQAEAYAYILERNAIARAVCGELGVRVIDLAAGFDTRGTADFREHFVDVLHFRHPAYPLVAHRVYEGIADLVT